MWLATKTLDAINQMLEKDQGAKFRGHLRHLMPQAEDAYREEESTFRTHLGASMIGRECAREIWYGHRWTTRPRHIGRMVRLFNRGHLEEPRFIAMLLGIGCKVWQLDQNGNQFRVSSFGGHYSGSLDGVALGIPEMPETPILTEFKTHNDKSFQKLVSSGVLNAKWEHFVQMQQYMGKMNLTHALYMAVNKNDDTLHAEIVQFDQRQFERYHDRANEILLSQDPPPRINNSIGYFKCKFCDHSPVCHGGAIPDRNCRTCRYSRPEVSSGQWVCDNIVCPGPLDKEIQLKSCSHYEQRESIKAK